MRIANGFTFFWKRTPLSNWHRGNPFIVDGVTFTTSLSNWHRGNPFIVDGVTFTTSEHYMMYKKAELFGDTETMALILNKDNQHPKEAKARGREVFPFDDAKWKSVARDIMFEGIREKFVQNPDILPDILSTKGTRLVEASPFDPIWGVGLVEEDDLILDPKNWKGLNWLGETLVRL